MNGSNRLSSPVRGNGLSRRAQPAHATDGGSIRSFARQYARELDEFASEVLALLGGSVERRMEACAATWASTLLAIDASSFSVESREELVLSLFEALSVRWQRQAFASAEEESLFQQRAAGYVEQGDPGSQIRSAARLAENLTACAGVPTATRATLAQTLSNMFALRMLGDVFRFNEAHACHLSP